jgi:bifunctional non-homologous end joining protein LigD
MPTEKRKSVLSVSSFKTPFPGEVSPMLATLTDKPFDGDNWIFEIKYDGYRIISLIKNKKVKLTSRKQQDYSDRYIHVTKELEKKIKKDVVLDGEVVIDDENGVSNFQLLQNYTRTREGQVVYYVFDILWLDGYNLEQMPLIDRKELLRKILPKSSNFIKYSDHVEREGRKLFKLAVKQGLEGLIAKKKTSFYYEGARSNDWLKIKTEKRQEVVICGYTEPRASRKFFGALILGVYEKGKLTYVGHTGTGFDYATLKDIYNLISKFRQKESPFEDVPKTNMPVTWVKPEIVCEIKFSNFTTDGIMRHPVFMGIREDKRAKEVVRETAK